MKRFIEVLLMVSLISISAAQAQADDSEDAAAAAEQRKQACYQALQALPAELIRSQLSTTVVPFELQDKSLPVLTTAEGFYLIVDQNPYFYSFPEPSSINEKYKTKSWYINVAIPGRAGNWGLYFEQEKSDSKPKFISDGRYTVGGFHDGTLVDAPAADAKGALEALRETLARVVHKLVDREAIKRDPKLAGVYSCQPRTAERAKAKSVKSASIAANDNAS